MRRLMALGMAIGMIGTLAACTGRTEQPVTRQIIAMDTAMTFTTYGKQGNETVQAAVEEVQRLEKLLSRTDPDSAVGALDRSGGDTVVGEEVCRLVETAGEFTDATGGAFDITIAPLVSAWGFTGDGFRVPEAEELAALLEQVGMENVHLSGNEQGAPDTIRLDLGTQIDLGGIAKGYAADRMAEIFAENSLERGWVSLGGNVLAWGTRPDGEPWRVGIQHPGHPDEEPFAGMLSLQDAFAVTSGGYQRFFEEDGKTYHHIIDPATGYPADSGLVSVTVVADSGTPGNGTMCDALSTALFVMGEEKALDFWRGSGYDFDLVLVTDDGRVLVTSGLADRFAETEGSGYAYETVS